MNTYRVTYVYKGDKFTEWYEAKSESHALVMLGAELSDEWINNLDSVHAVIETN